MRKRTILYAAIITFLVLSLGFGYAAVTQKLGVDFTLRNRVATLADLDFQFDVTVPQAENCTVTIEEDEDGFYSTANIETIEFSEVGQTAEFIVRIWNRSKYNLDIGLLYSARPTPYIQSYGEYGKCFDLEYSITNHEGTKIYPIDTSLSDDYRVINGQYVDFHVTITLTEPPPIGGSGKGYWNVSFKGYPMEDE